MEKTNNFLVPKHRKLSKEEENSVLKKYGINSVSKLPKIKVKDSALAELGAEIDDVIEITRKSFAGESKYFRVVVE